MSPINWGNCRRPDNSIMLVTAARMTGCNITPRASEYLKMVEKLYPIMSRQVAALAIASALEISAREPQEEGIK